MGAMPLRWDLYCHVVDNFGDVGVCWRLAAELAARGHTVRLVIDDSRALAWMAPQGASGVTIVDWSDAPTEPAEVLIEAFGCELPQPVRASVFAARRPPVWLNLEYLTAEGYAESAHGLASPQFDAAHRRVDKWFFFPGFGARSGGLIREAGLMARRLSFSRVDWLASQSIEPRDDERVVSLFSYADAPLAAMLDGFAAAGSAPTLLLSTGGRFVDTGARASVRVVSLPWLSQVEFDHLLWSCDLNFVRGEDSVVRAQWAGVPFVWQAYPQPGGAHAAKVDAFLDAMGAAADVRALFHAWNRIDPAAHRSFAWPEETAWREAAASWQLRLAGQPDLVSRLIEFVAGKR